MDKVFVARYEHKHGVDVRVFKTQGAAECWGQEIAREWWESEMPSDKAMPEDAEERAEEYFEYVSDREYFEVTEIDVEG